MVIKKPFGKTIKGLKRNHLDDELIIIALAKKQLNGQR